MTTIGMSREQLLEHAFTDIPTEIGTLTLRPVSAASFTLLARIKNPMLVRSGADPDDQAGMFNAIIEFIWIHAAPLEDVVKIRGREDMQKFEEAVQMMGFGVTMGQALVFLSKFQEAAERMTAGLTNIAEDETATPGKPEASLPAGSPHLSSPAVLPEIPHGSDTSSGSCPSNGPSPIFTLPTLPPEPSASGPSQTLESSNPTTTPPQLSERSETAG